MEINLDEYTKFIVTGTLVNGRKFRQVHSNGRHAFGINLYRGRVWGVRKVDGKRTLLKTVWN